MNKHSLIAAVEDALLQGLALLDGLDSETYSRTFEGRRLGHTIAMYWTTFFV